MFIPVIFNRNFVNDILDDKFPIELNKNNNLMNTDIKELKDSFLLELELPGFNKENIKAEVKDGYLTVSATHSSEKEEKDQEGKYIKKERSTGHCSRSFYIGEVVTEKDISAKFENGILKITIPKKEKIEKLEEKKYVTIEG
ncbi:Hsp20/alpha crystallin family protein [Fusobacterium sp. PH5-44]|uniref:Hsp20/alpha crystallin family protein n=1 Tax=unclassified Fusobacterium TaxID=2648384 RepID=UPI003D1B8106